MFNTFGHHVIAMAIVSLLACFSDHRTHAQQGWDTVIEVSGKLKSARGNLMVITRDDDTDVTVMIPDDPTELNFSATAKPAWLRNGMLIRVQAMFGPTGQPQMPIDKVELFTPFQAKKLAGHDRERFIAGVYPADANPNANSLQGGFQAGVYKIVGDIAGMSPEGILVNAGNKRVPLPVAQDASFLIQYNNLSLAEPGDLVNVSGFHQPPDETKIKASSVTVKVDRVYGEATENPKMRKRTRETSATKQDATKSADDTVAETSPQP